MDIRPFYISTIEDMIMKTIKIIFLSIFIVLLLVPVVTMNIQSGYASTITNAMLPELDLKNFSREDVDKYIAERIGFHDEAITKYSMIDFLVF